MKSVPVGLIGKATKSKKLIVNGLSGKKVVNTDITTLKRNWKKPFRKLMHEKS